MPSHPDRVRRNYQPTYSADVQAIERAFDEWGSEPVAPITPLRKPARSFDEVQRIVSGALRREGFVPLAEAPTSDDPWAV